MVQRLKCICQLRKTRSHELNTFVSWRAINEREQVCAINAFHREHPLSVVAHQFFECYEIWMPNVCECTELSLEVGQG